MKSVLLLSGGLDSAANLALACEEGSRPVLALTLDYGQQAARREAEAARKLADYYDVRHETIDVRWLGALGGSALTSEGGTIPDVATGDLDNLGVTRRSAQAVWVPNRNGVFIQAAAAYAESLGIEVVLVGFNLEEAQTFADNSEAFLEASNRALKYSTRNGVRVACYTATWDKKRIVRELRGLKRPFPFELLWSCYRGLDKPCGECESCRRQARARAGG